jgi:hypothetical protein
VAEVSVPINDALDSIELFKNEDGSGWMKIDDWNQWKYFMSGDGTDRDRGRRHKASYNARAAALITQAPPDEVEALAAKVYREARRDWERKHDLWGRMSHQFQVHFVALHWVGTIALNFIPIVGPVLSGLATQLTPMVEAAQQKAVARREDETITERFRGDYYNAMDEWLAGGAELPMEFLQYQAEVVVPAARDLRNQIVSGQVETAEGLYPLDQNGFDVWVSMNPDFSLLPVYGGPLQSLRREWRMNMNPILLGFSVGGLFALTTHLFMKRFSH